MVEEDIPFFVVPKYLPIKEEVVDILFYISSYAADCTYLKKRYDEDKE